MGKMAHSLSFPAPLFLPFVRCFLLFLAWLSFHAKPHDEWDKRALNQRSSIFLGFVSHHIVSINLVHVSFSKVHLSLSFPFLSFVLFVTTSIVFADSNGAEFQTDSIRDSGERTGRKENPTERSKSMATREKIRPTLSLILKGSATMRRQELLS